MIYGKIYVDNDDVILDFVNKYVPGISSPSGYYLDNYGQKCYSNYKCVKTSSIIISEEAIEKLKNLITYRNPLLDTSKIEGDIAFQNARYNYSGYVLYNADDVLRLNENTPIIVNMSYPFHLNDIKKLLVDCVILENEEIKNITLPFDEDEIETSKELTQLEKDVLTLYKSIYTDDYYRNQYHELIVSVDKEITDQLKISFERLDRIYKKLRKYNYIKDEL